VVESDDGDSDDDEDFEDDEESDESDEEDAMPVAPATTPAAKVSYGHECHANPSVMHPHHSGTHVT